MRETVETVELDEASLGPREKCLDTMPQEPEEESFMGNWTQHFQSLFPPLNVLQQRVSLAMYRLLCKGQPISLQILSQRLEIPIEVLQDLLNRCPLTHFDDQGQIMAYRGLTLKTTPHRLKIENGSVLYAWCAWDTLFLPEILKANVQVDSICPTTRSPIHLNLSPQGVEQIEPEETVISFVNPNTVEIEEHIVAHLCPYVHFFASKEAGLTWTQQHSGTLLLTIDQAHRLGRKINAVQYTDSQRSS